MRFDESSRVRASRFARGAIGQMMDATVSGSKVRVGIIGVGNCASSFVQGLSYYAVAGANEPVPGLMHTPLGSRYAGECNREI